VRSKIEDLLSPLHALYLYGAAAIAAFGWALCKLLDVEAASWLPLWFCAALFIYNVDRLRGEPADALNVPLRTATIARCRRASLMVAMVAGGVLLVLPALRRDWSTLALAAGGGLVCLNYSIPVGGFRLRAVPLLKTFFAPSVVVAAILVPPALHGQLLPRAPATLAAAAWAWCFLLFNTLLCDLRDIPGDRACGVESLASRLGARRTGRVLAGLILATSLLAVANAPFAGRDGACWMVLAGIGPVALSFLVIEGLARRSERFYEWCVDGMLFLPALVVAATPRF
jgi:4-hydroxybenzoate polyprenyltransferase